MANTSYSLPYQHEHGPHLHRHHHLPFHDIHHHGLVKEIHIRHGSMGDQLSDDHGQEAVPVTPTNHPDGLVCGEQD